MRMMNENLVIELAHLPEEGKAYSGELDQKIFDLPKKDAKPLGPLEYDLYVQRFDDELLLRGYLAAPFEFMCVRTNKFFKKTIILEEAAISIEIEGGSANATEYLREEVLINFPAYPRCDEGDDPEDCEIDDRYLALDKPIEDSVTDAPPTESDDRWSALDGLNQFKDNN